MPFTPQPETADQQYHWWWLHPLFLVPILFHAVYVFVFTIIPEFLFLQLLGAFSCDGSTLPPLLPSNSEATRIVPWPSMRTDLSMGHLLLSRSYLFYPKGDYSQDLQFLLSPKDTISLYFYHIMAKKEAEIFFYYWSHSPVSQSKSLDVLIWGHQETLMLLS